MAGRVKQKYVRSTVNAGQIRLLELVYKYRFGSRQLLAESLGVKPENGLYEKLEVLVKRGDLAKRFEKALKLQGVPAAYYLTPQGLRTLQELPGHEHITDAVIKASYADKRVGMNFVVRSLNVYKYTNVLKRQYEGLRVFTKRDLSQYDYFPSQLPDAVLSLPTTGSSPQRFFFDYVSDTMPLTSLDRRIANYCEFFDEGGWEATNSPLPALLLLAEWSPAEKRIQRRVRAQLSSADMEELAVYTSTINALGGTASELSIWTSIEDTDELTDLRSVS